MQEKGKNMCHVTGQMQETPPILQQRILLATLPLSSQDATAETVP